MKKTIISFVLLVFLAGMMLSRSTEFRVIAVNLTGAPKFASIIPLPLPPLPKSKI